MSNVVPLKPKKNVTMQLTCPECDGTKWRVILSLVKIEGSDLHHADLYCQTEDCEFVTPAVLILPEGDDEDD
jgi:hypothetical protein